LGRKREGEREKGGTDDGPDSSPEDFRRRGRGPGHPRLIHHNSFQNQTEILDQTIDNTLYRHYTCGREGPLRGPLYHRWSPGLCQRIHPLVSVRWSRSVALVMLRLCYYSLLILLCAPLLLIDRLSLWEVMRLMLVVLGLGWFLWCRRDAHRYDFRREITQEF